MADANTDDPIDIVGYRVREARKAADRGWVLIRLKGKKPVGKNWPKAKKCTPDAAELMARSGNIGVVTGSASGVIVVDDDSTDGSATAALNLPRTVTAITGSGKRHCYFRCSNEHLGNSAGKLGPKIDIRADGGQIVLPGSVHPDTGKPYVWAEGLSPDDMPLADFPPHLLNKLCGESASSEPRESDGHANGAVQMDQDQARQTQPRTVASKKLRRQVEKTYARALACVRSARPGTRNNELNRVAYSLGGIVAHGLLERASVERDLRDAALQAGLGPDEIDRTTRSGLDSGVQQPFDLDEAQRETVDSADDHEEWDDDPHRLAGAFLKSIRHRGGNILRFWREEWYTWHLARYRVMVDKELRARVCRFIKTEFDRIARENEHPPAKVTTALVTNVLQALTGKVLVRSSIEPPVWLPGGRSRKPVCPSDDILVFPNGIVHLPTLAAGRPDTWRPTPRLFSINALKFKFVATAPPPQMWLDFLSQLWPEDPEAIALLQEWFGYCLVLDTSQQKILLLIGPRRSGKGTIVRVLRGLLGEENVAGPTLGSLATNFGMWPLLGKLLAVIHDARLSARADQTVIVERLLSISGEDAVTVDRKYLMPVTSKLATRLMILTNELPRLRDISGALASRMIVLKLTRSWLGKEDPKLTRRLLGELPGILLWSIEGWKRLRERGHFAQPESGAELVEDIRDLTSPISLFVQECCALGRDYRVPRGALFAVWQEWCAAHDELPEDPATFGRSLHAAIPGLASSQPRDGDRRERVYVGIALKEPVP